MMTKYSPEGGHFLLLYRNQWEKPNIKTVQMFFSKKDYLTPQQIASFFSRHAKKRKAGFSSNNDDEKREENVNDEEKIWR